MALTRKARTTLALTRGLTALHLLPSTQKVLSWPEAKRLKMGPGKRMLGHVPDVPFEDVQVPVRDGSAIRVRVYRPEGATAPLLYAHGGGFALGGIRSCDHICRRLAVEAHAVVVSVEYRLAPGRPFPGPLQDCEDALDWLLAQGWDTERLVVGGDSAGGNLAAALAMVLHERGTPLAGQLLIYPAVDLTASGAGVLGYDGPGLTPADCEASANAYLGAQDRTQPLASPLLAPSLAGLAPAFVLTVEHDPLRAEGLAYAARLREAGVPTTALDVPDHLHGSLSTPTLFVGIDELYVQMSAFVRDPAGVTADA